MGSIITFYSYKGGVGRTMALANVAIQLSHWGYKVLIVDWDLEAPGLEYYFNEYISLNSTTEIAGVIDLISQDLNEGFSTLNWKDLVIKINVPSNIENEERFSIDLITSGKRDDKYFEKVTAFNFQKYYQDLNGGQYIEKLRREWKYTYDFTLIDSRTGVTDIGGVCTVQFPDILVLLFTANEQSLNGTIRTAKKASEARYLLPFDRFNLLTLPIPSRFDANDEFSESQHWLNKFVRELKPLFDSWAPENLDKKKFLELLKIPYIPYLVAPQNNVVMK